MVRALLKVQDGEIQVWTYWKNTDWCIKCSYAQFKHRFVCKSIILLQKKSTGRTHLWKLFFLGQSGMTSVEVGCSNPHLPRLIPTVYFPRGLWYTALSTFTFLLYHCHCVKHEFIIKKIIHYKMLKCLSPPEVFGPVFRRVRFGSWVQILEKRVT